MQASMAADVQRFVYSSSLLVYSSHDEAIDKNTPATSELGIWKGKTGSGRGVIDYGASGWNEPGANTLTPRLRRA
jgi:hypothetical protein